MTLRGFSLARANADGELNLGNWLPGFSADPDRVTIRMDGATARLDREHVRALADWLRFWLDTDPEPEATE